MAEGLKQFPGEVLLIPSGQDCTAREFVGYVGSNTAWKELTGAAKVSRIVVEDADHTFSSWVLRLSVEQITKAWLDKSSGLRRIGSFLENISLGKVWSSAYGPSISPPHLSEYRALA